MAAAGYSLSGSRQFVVRRLSACDDDDDDDDSHGYFGNDEQDTRWCTALPERLMLL